MGAFNRIATARAFDAPAPMIFCLSTPGAYVRNPFVKLSLKMVSAKELKRALPKYWLNTTMDVPIAASVVDNVL